MINQKVFSGLEVLTLATSTFILGCSLSLTKAKKASSADSQVTHFEVSPVGIQKNASGHDHFEIGFYNPDGTGKVGSLVFHDGVVLFKGHIAKSAAAFAQKVPEVCKALEPVL